MEKIIFVDIDGCLTSIEDGSSYLCLNPDNYRIGRKHLDELVRIMRETGCKVVISSNWRRFPDDGYILYGGMKYYNPLVKFREMLGDCCIGDLPHDLHITKSEALELWFEDMDLKKSDIEFAIIDDDLSEGFASNPSFIRHYFFCNAKFGLTDEIADDIIRFFNRK